MSEQHERKPANFVVTKGYRLFAEMCDACRQDRFVGLGYGPPGTGKTLSAKYYAQWSLFKPFLPESLITFTGRSAMDDLCDLQEFMITWASLCFTQLSALYTSQAHSELSPSQTRG